MLRSSRLAGTKTAAIQHPLIFQLAPRIVFSEFVEPELVAIWDYIAIDSIDAADRFTESAHDTFQELARMPNTGNPKPDDGRSHIDDLMIRFTAKL